MTQIIVKTRPPVSQATQQMFPASNLAREDLREHQPGESNEPAISTSPPVPETTSKSNSASIPPRTPIEAALIKLAEILTKDEMHVPWMNMKEVAKKCQNHRHQIQKVVPYGYPFNARRMEEQAIEFFEKHYCMITDKVKVEACKQSKELEHRNDRPWEFQLSFHQFDRANDAALLAMENA